MQFQVPQFIEVEDKIFGPFTFKQFIYVAGAAGLAYILWRFLPLFVAVPLILGVLGLGAALAFLEYNGRPFILALEHGFYYLIHPKLYLWSTERKKGAEATPKMAEKAEIHVPKLSDSKLTELAWSLDIQDRVAKADTPEHVASVADEPRI